MITVFYDGKCGLCRREIEHYKRIAANDVFEWVDITIAPQPFTALGYRVSDGLKVLHVQDTKGRMHQGVAAFITIWQHLPRGWPLAAKILRIPLLLKLAEKIYILFAAWRYKKLGYDQCDIS
jgi:predicted DCC family thiol-disulfide oxidoreductase YuxK